MIVNFEHCDEYEAALVAKLAKLRENRVKVLDRTKMLREAVALLSEQYDPVGHIHGRGDGPLGLYYKANGASVQVSCGYGKKFFGGILLPIPALRYFEQVLADIDRLPLAALTDKKVLARHKIEGAAVDLFYAAVRAKLENC